MFVFANHHRAVSSFYYGGFDVCNTYLIYVAQLNLEVHEELDFRQTQKQDLDGHELLDEKLSIVLLALELALQPQVFPAQPLVHPVESVRHLLRPVELRLRSPRSLDPSAVPPILSGFLFLQLRLLLGETKPTNTAVDQTLLPRVFMLDWLGVSLQTKSSTAVLRGFVCACIRMNNHRNERQYSYVHVLLPANPKSGLLPRVKQHHLN